MGLFLGEQAQKERTQKRGSLIGQGCQRGKIVRPWGFEEILNKKGEGK